VSVPPGYAKAVSLLQRVYSGVPTAGTEGRATNLGAGAWVIWLMPTGSLLLLRIGENQPDPKGRALAQSRWRTAWAVPFRDPKSTISAPVYAHRARFAIAR